MKILVFQTAFLGDLFLSLPLLKALRTQYPQSNLGLVCRKKFGEFFVKTGFVDDLFEVDKKSRSSLKTAFEATKKFSPDLVISAHRSVRTALWVKRLNAPMSIGFHETWNFWAYKKRVDRNTARHDVYRQLSLLEALGWDSEDFGEEILYPSIKISANEKFKNLENSIAIAPGSQWETKRWPVENYISLIEKLLSEGKRITLVGGVEEREIAQIISSKLPSVNNIVGETTIFELAQVLSRCRLLVSNDSGAMHVATTVGIPVIGIFGPTVPSQGYAPWSKKSLVVEKDLACRPCGAHGHHKCPIGTHDCMKKLSPETVMQSVTKVIL